MWKYNSPDELYHYGVKGMKWGKHKKRNDPFPERVQNTFEDGSVFVRNRNNTSKTGVSYHEETPFVTRDLNPRKYSDASFDLEYSIKDRNISDVKNRSAKRSVLKDDPHRRARLDQNYDIALDAYTTRNHNEKNQRVTDDLKSRVRASKREKASAPKKLKKRRPGSAAEVQRRTQKALKKIGKMRMQAK